MSSLNDYLFVMAQEHVDFRLPELNSICELIGKKDSIKDHNYSNDSPVFSCRLENDELANEIAKRCILLKFIINLYNRADNLDSLISEIKQTNKNIKYEKNDTFKIDIYTFGKIYSQNERINIIENLISALEFEENEMKVCLKENEVKHRFFYVEDWIETDEKIDRRVLKGCYFGKFVCNGQSTISNKYNLKDRGFIGNTSMDPKLALIMSNMAQCTSNSLIYDPFVGTGSILVGAAHFGAHVAGADLDYNLIHSRGLSSRVGQKYRRKDQTIRNNLQQYGLESSFLDIFVADFARQVIRSSFEFDCIISDPPYGIREKTKRTVGRKDENENVEEESELAANSKSFPKHVKYELGDIYYDLLDFAFKHLVDGGRLVFWMPVYLEETERKSMNQIELLRCLEAFIPKHSGLELIVFSEQRLQRSTSRILVTMEKKKSTTTNVDSRKSLQENSLASVENDTTPNSNPSHLNQFREKYFSVKK